MRLLIVDDHALLRAGMRTMLSRESDLEVVGEARDGWEAGKLCHSLRLELVLMDVSMPEMEDRRPGDKGRAAQTSVPMLTAHADQDLLLDAVGRGPRATCSRTSGPPSWSARSG